jgi:invasion protein IalB
LTIFLADVRPMNIGRLTTAQRSPRETVMTKILTFVLASLALASQSLVSPALAQQAPAKPAPRAPAPAKPAPAAQAAPPAAPTNGAETPAQPQWLARCVSERRQGPMECSVEQSAMLAQTGQMVVQFSVRMVANAPPNVVAQLPLGLNIPIGVKLQVDDGKTADFQIQTCEARGCVIAAPLPADLLAAMKTGTQLKVIFQNLKRENLTVPLALAGFAAALEKVQ